MPDRNPTLPVAQQDWPEPNGHLYLMLHNSPRGYMSKTGTLAVTTHGVQLQIKKKYYFLFPLVAKHHMSLQLRWRHLTFRHMGCRAMSQRASEFFAAHVTY